MGKILFLSLAILCTVSNSSAQTCGGCTSSCSGGSTSNCCAWDDPPVQTSDRSFTDPNGTPLGFTTGVMPHVESGDPKPCFVVTTPDTDRQIYMSLLLDDSSDTVCVREVDGNTGEESQNCIKPFVCNSNGYKGVPSVRFNFDCESCSASDVTFRYRVFIEVVDAVDEFWCDRANMTTPTQYFLRDNTAFPVTDISQPTVATESAPHLLVTPALLVISIMIAALYTL